MREDEDELPIDRMVTVATLMEMEGIKHSEAYRRMHAGEYEAYKDGSKKVLVSLRSILRRRKLHLRKAEFAFGTRGSTRGIPRKEAVA